MSDDAAVVVPHQTVHYRIERNWRGRWIAREKDSGRALCNAEFPDAAGALHRAAWAEDVRRAGRTP